MKSEWVQSAFKHAAKDQLFNWRKSQFDQVLSNGFPTRKDEQWKYTDVSSILDANFKIPENSQAKVENLPITRTDLDATRIVFVNGVLSSSLPESDDITILPISMAVERGLVDEKFLNTDNHSSSSFTLLNNALFQTGLYIAVKDGKQIQKPIHIVHVQMDSAQPVMQTMRHVIVASKNSHVSVFEEYIGGAEVEYFNNVLTQIFAKPGSLVSHYRLQNEDFTAFHIGKILISQEANSQVNTFHFNFGAKLARHDLHYQFLEKNASAKMIGLYVGKDKQHLDSHTLVEHIAPHCESDQVYRGVLSDASHGVFNGKIKVYPDAQKTAAFLNNRNLLLSKKSQVDTKPELEIDADDVKCSHGATVGCIDPETLFYLRSRGIPEVDAKQLLIQAFISELFEELPNEQIRSHIKSVVVDDIV